MATKFLSRLFSGSSSTSSKRPTFRSSQTSINENSGRTGASSNMRSATSLDNISSYYINPKELDKNKLHKASWEGNIHKVERLARPGQIDLKDQHFRTPLHLAIVKGHLDIIKYLVHEGAKLDVVDNEQRTPLVKAVLSRNQNHQLNYQICIILLNGGADAFINAVDNQGRNALHYAIEYANEDLVELFLSVPSCDPNFQDRDQMTPLHLAVKRNSANIVRALLSDQHEQPADANLTNRNGQTALHMAASTGYVEVIRAILQSNLDEPCDPTIVDSHQLTAYQVAKANHQDISAKLIDEYQQGWTRLSPRREPSELIHEQQINPVMMNPSGHLDDDDEESSDGSSRSGTSQSSRSSSGQIQRSSNQWSDRAVPSTKQDSRSLADMIKRNPLQPDINQTNASKPTNQALAGLMQSIPLKPDLNKTDTAKPTNQSLAHLMHSIPAQPGANKTDTSKPNNQSLTNSYQNVSAQPSTNKTNVSKPIKHGSSNLIHSIPAQPPEYNRANLSKPDNHGLSNLMHSIPAQPDTNRADHSKPNSHGLSDLMHSIPLQPDTNKTDLSKPNNQILTTSFQNVPTQSDLNKTDLSKPNNHGLSSLMHSIPAQPDLNKTDLSKPNNHGLSNLMHSIPTQSDLNKTDSSKPNNHGLSNLMHSIPLQPNESSKIKPDMSQQKQPSSIYDIGPVTLQNKQTDNTPTNMSIEKALIGTNLIAGQPSSPKKNATVTSLVHALPHPDLHQSNSNSNSWSHDLTPTHKQTPAVTQARRAASWDDSSTTQSDDDTEAVRMKSSLKNYPQQQPLNGTTMFTTTPTTKPIYNQNDSKSEEEDSIEAAIQQINTQKASTGIQNLVNQQIGNKYMSSQQTPLSNIQSPTSDNSSWTTSSATPTKGISALIHQQPLIAKKTNEPTMDDSRPLSADLNRSSRKSKTQMSSSSDESDDDRDRKSATIIKSPLTHLVQTSMRPTEFTDSKTTGVENLIKIIEAIKHSATTYHKQPTPQRTIDHLLNNPVVKHSDSLSSNDSSILASTVRTLTIPTVTTSPSKRPIYHDEADEHHWPALSSTGHDFKLLSRKDSNEMLSHSQQQSSRASIHHDFNNLRGSMSSSTSSIQNNMERITELKEDIKQIERKQEDSFELKRQLKDMEIKKNNFEALYKKNDQLLRETETKLEKEINEKQRLEWTTKNLNMELKSVKQKLQLLEDEKDILNQRCVKLKEERDNYDEKLRIHHTNSLQATAAGVLRDEDIEKIKLRHREEMKLLSAENDDLHQRTKQLQSDLQLHKESLDVTIRYKIDLEKALDEKTFLQHELDRLKHEKDFIEQEKVSYKTKYDSLQEDIRLMLLDRSKIEQKLTNELQELTKQRQRSTDDIKKYKTQIEHLNIKLGDAEARLLVLQTQNEALLVSKDREIKNEFDTLTHRLNIIESAKLNAEQRYHNEHKQITDKQQQQHVLHEPLVLHTSSPLTNPAQPHHHHHHSASSPCTKCDTLQRSYEHEREHRLQTEKDNERLRDVVSRQKQQHELERSFQQHHENENVISENSKQMRSETERVKYELSRLRQDFDKLVSNYEPPNNFQQQAQLHSQIDTLRLFYEQEFRQQQLLMSKLPNGIKPAITTTMNGYHHASSPMRHDEHDHSHNGSMNCSCSNSRLLKERLENAIDTSLADQRIQTIKQMPFLPRQTLPISTTNNNGVMSTADFLRKRYYL